MAKIPPEPGASHALALVRVPIEGTEIEAGLNGEDGTTIRVSVRRMCEALGLNFGAQLRRLHRTPWATVAMMATVAEDGKARELAMVDVDTLAMWLATIELGRVKESARPMLVAYQKRAARVLREYFFPHFAPPLAPVREPHEAPELAAAVELLGGVDPRVRAALRKLPAPRKPSVEHWIERARELERFVERADAPIPTDPMESARLASALILATASSPDHPVMLGTRDDLAKTIALVDRLLSQAAVDPELRERVMRLRGEWSAELARLGVCHG